MSPRDGDDVRAVPILCAARGDGARPAAARTRLLAWRATPSSRTRCSRRTLRTRRARSRASTTSSTGRGGTAACGSSRRTASIDGRAPRRAGLGRRTRPTSAPRCRRAWPSTCGRTARLPSVTVDVVVARHRRPATDARRRLGPHARDGRRRRRRSAATACGGSRAGTGRRRRSAGPSAPRRTSGSGGRSTSTSDGRLLGSMQYGPVAPVSPRGRPPAGPAVGRRRARDLRVPRAGRRGVDREVAAPRRDRRVARPRARRRSRRSPTATRRASRSRSGSSSTAPCSRATSSTSSASSRVRAQGRVELCRLELGGLVPVEEGRRAKVLRVVQEAFTPSAGAGVRARRAQAARAATPSSSSSAIWIAFSAAPLRRLSLER